MSNYGLCLQSSEPKEDMSHDQDQSDAVDHTLKVDDDDLFASAVQVSVHSFQLV